MRVAHVATGIDKAKSSKSSPNERKLRWRRPGDRRANQLSSVGGGGGGQLEESY